MLSSCVSQHQTAVRRATVFDCEVLVKKQRHQYKKMMLQAKAHQRRKPSPVKPQEQRNVSTLSKIDYPAALRVENTHQELTAYSPSLFTIPPANVHENDRITTLHPHFSQTNSQYNTHKMNSPERIIETEPVLEEFTNDTWVWPSILLGGAAGMLMIVLFQKQAKLLARWAKDNKWKARSGLALLKIGTTSGCFLVGNELYNSGVAIPDFVNISGFAVLATAFALYPSKYFPSVSPAFGFLERKFCDASIFAAAAIVMLYAGNHFDVKLHRADPVQTVVYAPSPSNETGGVYKKISVVKKEFKQKLKTFLQDRPKEKTRGAKTALTILAVLAAIVLTYGVASLSCSISCSGSEVAAVFVFFGGVTLIVWGLVATIRSIHNRPTKKRATLVKPAA